MRDPIFGIAIRKHDYTYPAVGISSVAMTCARHVRRMSYAAYVICGRHMRGGLRMSCAHGWFLVFAPGQFTPQTFQLWQPQSLRHMGSCLAGPVPGRFTRKRHVAIATEDRTGTRATSPQSLRHKDSCLASPVPGRFAWRHHEM